MKDYETVFVLHPRLDDSQVEEEIKKVKDMISAGGGTLIDVQKWGRKRLAYEIRKVHEGIYTLIQFTGDPPLIQEQDRRFKLNENVLRHLTVVAHPKAVRRRGESDAPSGTKTVADESAPAGAPAATPSPASAEAEGPPSASSPAARSSQPVEPEEAESGAPPEAEAPAATDASEKTSPSA